QCPKPLRRDVKLAQGVIPHPAKACANSIRMVKRGLKPRDYILDSGCVESKTRRSIVLSLHVRGDVMSSIITRRTFIGASIFIPGIVPRLIAQDARSAGMSPAVQTTGARVRGLVRYGVNQFYGVPYAASTAGANRFM